MTRAAPPPVVWTIAGSDSGGGAGLQADGKTFAGLGVHGCSVVTAITAQSTTGISRIDCLDPEWVAAQLDALAGDLPPAAIKIGMLGNEEIASVVAQRLEEIDAFAVWDPVMQASTGRRLWQGDRHGPVRNRLLPRIDLVTPNLPEAEALVGEPLADDRSVEQAAQAIRAMGVGCVLIKGGHRVQGDVVQDYFADGRTGWWLSSPRLDAAGTHGTGCVLSSAIAAAMALGYPLEESIVFGRGVVTHALRHSAPLGKGNGPVGPSGPPDCPEDLAWIHPDAARGRRRRQFPSAGGEPIGLYPIVDSVEWVERLLPHQPLWLQLRIKDSSREHRDDDIRRAIALAKPTATRLIVNDHWESALRYGAEGVHLGQDDLDASALDALERAGVILGISTHNIAELARAIAEGPSYLALGTVFHTTSKTMDYEPLGLDSFRRLRKLVRQPVVAIGGIHLPQASTVYEAGADGIAVISEIKDSREPGSVIAQWRREPSPPR